MRSLHYDAAGNLIQETTARHYERDYAGRMRAFRNQASGSEASVFAQYAYDAGGQRVQKVNSGAKESTVYIDGIFEHHRIHDGTSSEPENNTLQVMDDALHRPA